MTTGVSRDRRALAALLPTALLFTAPLFTALSSFGCADADAACLQECLEIGGRRCAPAVDVVAARPGETFPGCEGVASSGYCGSAEPLYPSARYVRDGERVFIRLDTTPPSWGRFHGSFLMIEVPRALAGGERSATVCRDGYTDVVGSAEYCPSTGLDPSSWRCASSGTVTMEADGSGHVDAGFEGGGRLEARWRL